MPAPAESPPPGASRSPAPSLLPREHGAWGQLAFPLVSALTLGRPRAGALLLAAAVVLIFLAHEPLLVLLGQRGRRLHGELGARSARRLAWLLAAAAAAGVAGLLLAPAEARTAAIAPAALAAVVVQLTVFRLEKTTAGELAVASAFAACAAPVAIAAGAPQAWALGAAATWVAAFAAATLPVRAILQRARTKGAIDHRPLAGLGVAVIEGVAVWLAAEGAVPWAVPVAVLPTGLAALALTVLPVRPQRLTTVGWTIVGASAATLLTLVVALRVG